MTAIFGAFLTDFDVEQAVIAHLREWMPDYLPAARRRGEAARAALGLDPFSDFPLPRSYPVSPREPDKWPEDQLPAIMIVSMGVKDRPTQDGDGLYRGTFSVGVVSICSAGDPDTSKHLAGLYHGAAASIILDKPSLGGFAEDATLPEGLPTDWLTGDRNRTLASRYSPFDIKVKALFTVTGGPSDHLDDPETDPGDFETPLTTDLELEKEEIPS